MRRSILFLFVVASFSTLLHTRVWPQLVLGGGYECVLIMTNESTVFASIVSLGLMQGNGEPWSGEWTANGQDGNDIDSYPIPPRGTMKIRLAGDSVLRSGYLEIAEPRLTVQFFYEYRQDGELIEVIGVSESDDSFNFIFPVERTPTANTGFAWARPSSQDASLGASPITLTLLDENGTVHEDPQKILYDGHLARFFDEVFTDVGMNFVGSVLIESLVPISLIAIRQVTTDRGFQLTSVPVDTNPGGLKICIGIGLP